MDAPLPDTVLAVAAQLAPELGELEGNRLRARLAIEDAARRGARLIVLPELALSGYCFAEQQEARRCAEAVPGPTTREWAQLAARHGLVIVAGLCELADDGSLRNSAVVIDGERLLCVHRKTHLWDREGEIFLAGQEPPPVVETSVGRVGVAICYEAFFPELMRALALAGADVVAVPMNSPLEGERLQPLPIEATLAIAAAHVNRVFVVQADRAGEERGTAWAEASVIVDCEGKLLAGPEAGERLLSATIAPARAREKRLGARNHLFEDMRPEMYGAIAGQINQRKAMEEYDDG